MLTKFEIEKLIPLNWLELLSDELDPICFETLNSELNKSLKTNQILPPVDQVFYYLSSINP